MPAPLAGSLPGSRPIVVVSGLTLGVCWLPLVPGARVQAHAPTSTVKASAVCSTDSCTTPTGQIRSWARTGPVELSGARSDRAVIGRIRRSGRTGHRRGGYVRRGLTGESQADRRSAATRQGRSSATSDLHGGSEGAHLSPATSLGRIQTVPQYRVLRGAHYGVKAARRFSSRSTRGPFGCGAGLREAHCGAALLAGVIRSPGRRPFVLRAHNQRRKC
jgi:hypothetical protein